MNGYWPAISTRESGTWYKRFAPGCDLPRCVVNGHAAYIFQLVQQRLDAIRLVLFGRDYEDNASPFAVRFAGEGADANHLAFENLENAREQPPLFGCVYMKLPGHSGSFWRE